MDTATIINTHLKKENKMTITKAEQTSLKIVRHNSGNVADTIELDLDKINECLDMFMYSASYRVLKNELENMYYSEEEVELSDTSIELESSLIKSCLNLAGEEDCYEYGVILTIELN